MRHLILLALLFGGLGSLWLGYRGLAAELEYARARAELHYDPEKSAKRLSGLRDSYLVRHEYLAAQGRAEALAGNYQEAEDVYRELARSQPASPYALLGISQINAVQQRFGTEFNRSIAEAQRRGPSERRLNREIALLGLRNWYLLSAEGRQQVRHSINLSLQTEPWELMARLPGYAEREIVCRRFEQPILHNWCKQYTSAQQ